MVTAWPCSCESLDPTDDGSRGASGNTRSACGIRFDLHGGQAPCLLGREPGVHGCGRPHRSRRVPAGPDWHPGNHAALRPCSTHRCGGHGALRGDWCQRCARRRHRNSCGNHRRRHIRYRWRDHPRRLGEPDPQSVRAWPLPSDGHIRGSRVLRLPSGNPCIARAAALAVALIFGFRAFTIFYQWDVPTVTITEDTDPSASST